MLATLHNCLSIFAWSHKIVDTVPCRQGHTTNSGTLPGNGAVEIHFVIKVSLVSDSCFSCYWQETDDPVLKAPPSTNDGVSKAEVNMMLNQQC